MFYICVPYSIEADDFIKSAFPVSTNQYWYFTAYFGVFFIMTYLNKMLDSLSKKDAKSLILTITFLFPLVSFYDDAFKLCFGYSFLWLAAMYIAGAYIKKLQIHITKKKSIMVYFVTAFTIWILKLIVENFGKEKIYTKISVFLVSYTSPLVVIMAAALLMAFSQIKINGRPERIIVNLSKLSFSVYLIHVNPLILTIY